MTVQSSGYVWHQGVFSRLGTVDLLKCRRVSKELHEQAGVDALWHERIAGAPFGLVASEPLCTGYLKQMRFAQRFSTGEPEEQVIAAQDYIASTGKIEEDRIFYMVVRFPHKTEVFEYNRLSGTSAQIGEAACIGMYLYSNGNNLVVVSLRGEFYLKRIGERKGFHSIPLSLFSQEHYPGFVPVKLGHDTIIAPYLENSMTHEDSATALQFMDLSSNKVQIVEIGTCTIRDILILNQHQVIVGRNEGNQTKITLIDTLEFTETELVQFNRKSVVYMAKLNEEEFLFTDPQSMQIVRYHLSRRTVTQRILLQQAPLMLEVIGSKRIACMGLSEERHHVLLIDLDNGQVLCKRAMKHHYSESVLISLQLAKGVIIFDRNSEPGKTHEVVMHSFGYTPGLKG